MSAYLLEGFPWLFLSAYQAWAPVPTGTLCRGDALHAAQLELPAISSALAIKTHTVQTEAFNSETE